MICLWGFVSFILFLASFSASAGAGETATFCAAGDVLLDRGCRTMIRRHGYDYLFARVGDFIHVQDLSLCNLENPVSYRGKAPGNAITFRADSAFVEVLKRSGFGIFCLANNHILDCGPRALLDTRGILESNGLAAVGAGRNADEAGAPLITRKRGMTFAFLAYVRVPGFGVRSADDRPRPAIADSTEIREGIARAHARADIVIVSFHWGVEYTPRPTAEQVNFAHFSIDSGADLVLGHHPHVIQSIEKYRGKFILYSLGNFVFDQHVPVQRESLLFCCGFRDRRIVSPHIIPVVLPPRSFRPVFPSCGETIRIMDRVKEISRGYGVTFRDSDTATYLE
jgi:poly-gamma-glutamate synthesis protein (capsule biosynthesis protein)